LSTKRRLAFGVRRSNGAPVSLARINSSVDIAHINCKLNKYCMRKI
jgi:hypothetical protein